MLIGSMFIDPDKIDRAVHAGLKADMFESPERSAIWGSMLKLRTTGTQVSLEDVALDMGGDCPHPELVSCDKSVSTSLSFKKALDAVIQHNCIRQVKPALNDVLSKIDDGEPYEDVKASLEAIPALLRPSESQEHTLAQIVDEAVLWATEQINGTASLEKNVITGFPHFDNSAMPIQMHEYVLLGARTSVGKSSFMAQMCNVNLARGLKCAYFTLETSARSVLLQIAAQRADANVRLLKHEMADRQSRFNRELEALRQAPLVVFERDLSLDQIEARCRLLAGSFKPDVVFLDYIGLIKTPGDGAYERMTRLSKAMIPLKKTLGCAIIVGAQLNRGNEKEDRKPTRTDFRDTGSLEEDAHRILCLHRPSRDDSGMEQGLDRSHYLTELYQLKLRDGPLAQTRLTFNAHHTKFIEKV